MKFNIIVMKCQNNGIGYQGTIPWKEPEDMKFFRKITTYVHDNLKKNAIIMGRKTFESIGRRPLKNRVNYVITKEKYDNVESFTSLDECLGHIDNQRYIENVFVIGGHGIYKEAMEHIDCEYLYVNVLEENHKCDVFFPCISPLQYKIISRLSLTEKIENYIYEKN